jgi:hypothetical protein
MWFIRSTSDGPDELTCLFAYGPLEHLRIAPETDNLLKNRNKSICRFVQIPLFSAPGDLAWTLIWSGTPLPLKIQPSIDAAAPLGARRRGAAAGAYLLYQPVPAVEVEIHGCLRAAPIECELYFARSCPSRQAEYEEIPSISIDYFSKKTAISYLFIPPDSLSTV